MRLKKRLLLSLNTGGLFISAIASAEEIGLMAADAYQPRFQYLPAVTDLVPKGGFSLSLGVQASYSSNFFLEETGGEGEFSLGIVPSILYRSDGDDSAMAWFELEYAPTYQTYLENSDLSNFQQNVNGTFNLRGSRTRITFYGRYSEISGSDRLAEGYVEGGVVNAGVTATYQLASRTSLGANIGFSKSFYETGQEGSETWTAGLSANWAYSERFSFGPYIRYSTTDSGSTGSMDSYAFLIQANYLLGERIRINGAIGLEFADDAGLTGDLTASYDFTERTNLSASVRYATIPSPAKDGYFVQDLTVSTQIRHQLTYGTVGLGVNWSTSFYEASGSAAASGDPEDDRFTGIVLSYARDFFSERVHFESSIGYSFNRGERDYDRWLFSVGVNIAF